MNKVNCYCKFTINVCSQLNINIHDIPFQPIIYLSLNENLRSLLYMFNPKNYVYSKEVASVVTSIHNKPDIISSFECENINDKVIKEELMEFNIRNRLVLGFLFEHGFFKNIRNVSIFGCVYYFYSKALINNRRTFKEINDYITEELNKYQINEILDLPHKKFNKFIRLSIKLDKRLICDKMF